MILVTVLTTMDGGINRLIKGYDSFGNICNAKNERVGSVNGSQLSGEDTTGRTNVFYFDYTNPLKSKKVCVKSCPNVTLTTVNEFNKYTVDNPLCMYNVPAGQYRSDMCPTLPVLATTPIANRCFPDFLKVLDHEILNRTEIQRLLSDNFNAQIIQTYVVRLNQQLPKIGWLSLISLGITIVLVALLRYIAKILVALVVFLAASGTTGITVFLWLKFAEYRRLVVKPEYSVPLLDIEMDIATAYLIYAIAATVLTLLFLLVLFFLRKRINLVIKLFAEAQKALIAMPLIFILPLFTFIILGIFIAYWLTTAFMIYSFGQYDTSELLLGSSKISRKTVTNIFWGYHIVGFIWISEFIFACQSMVIASSVAKWYFSRDKSSLGAPILSSIWRLTVYHLGSVAFGSLLIALLRIPRYILMYIHEKIKNSQSSIAKYCVKCCICCLWCAEKFMRYVNYNAYTIIAIEGKSFCTSAQKAFSIIAENALRMATINSVGDFMLFLAKVIVMAITLVIAVFWIHNPLENFQLETFKYNILPLLIVGIISFLVAHSFFTIYEMVVDALMVCFCEDCRANDGTPERPYFMSDSLRKLVDESSTTNIIGE